MTLNLTPFPARVAPEVLAAQAKQPGAALPLLRDKLKNRLKEVLYPDASSVAFFAGSRDLLFETALNSFPHAPFLLCVNGPLSRHWLDLARGLNADFDVIDTNYGSDFSDSQLEKKLEVDSYEAVILVEIDPYTGVRLDTPRISGIIRRILPDALIFVDVTASAGSVKSLELKAEADVLLLSSEISLGLPPGLGILLLSEKAHFKSIGYPGSGWSANYNRQLQLAHENSFRAPCPYPLLFALEKQLDRLFLEGEAARIERIQALSAKVSRWAAVNGFQIMAEADHQAPNFTVLKTPAQFSPQKILDFLELYGIQISICPDELKENYFTIAHMNHTSEEEIDEFLALMDKFVADYDVQKVLPLTKMPLEPI